MLETGTDFLLRCSCFKSIHSNAFRLRATFGQKSSSFEIRIFGPTVFLHYPVQVIHNEEAGYP